MGHNLPSCTLCFLSPPLILCISMQRVVPLVSFRSVVVGAGTFFRSSKVPNVSMAVWSFPKEPGLNSYSSLFFFLCTFLYLILSLFCKEEWESWCIWCSTCVLWHLGWSAEVLVSFCCACARSIRSCSLLTCKLGFAGIVLLRRCGTVFCSPVKLMMCSHSFLRSP